MLRVAILARSVYPLHAIGGLERHVYDLIRHLTARDVHVTLITKPFPIPLSSTDEPARPIPSPSPVATQAAEALGVPADRLRLISVPYVTFPGAGRRGTTVADRVTAYPFFGWRAGRVAAKLAYTGAVDLVYALGASGLGYAMARRRQDPTKPFVLNPQGLEEFGGTNPEHAPLKRIAYGPLQTAVRTCARAADAVIATDRALVPTLLRHLPVDLAHIEVVPNGIDLEHIDRLRRGTLATTPPTAPPSPVATDHESAPAAAAGTATPGTTAPGTTAPAAAETVVPMASPAPDPAALRLRHHIPEDAPLLLSVGRLEANKGFHILARALGQLIAQGRAANLRWTLVGDGPFRAEIEREAESAGLGSRMIVAGRVSEVELHGWYDAADLFVHPTLYEGSSLVTLEAMAHGRPILATRAGGLPDKVTPGDNGWLVDPDRPDQLADAVLDAIHTAPDVLAAMGRASRARVERDFAWPVIADKMIDVYRRLIAAEERS